MLAGGRTNAEVFETSRRYFGPTETTREKANNYILTLCALRGIPGKLLSDDERLAIRRIGTEVARGVPA